MFDLDKEIAVWSATLARRCGREADIAELEDHLRSSFEELSAEGMSPERAFELAVGRMGDVVEIDGEYEKNRSLVDRFHSSLARWERSWVRGYGRQRDVGVSVIVASLIIAISIVLADADMRDSTAAAYLLIVTGLLWLASRALLTRR